MNFAEVLDTTILNRNSPSKRRENTNENEGQVTVKKIYNKPRKKRLITATTWVLAILKTRTEAN